MKDLPECRVAHAEAPKVAKKKQKPKPKDAVRILEAGFPLQVAAYEANMTLDEVSVLWAEHVADKERLRIRERKAARKEAQRKLGSNVYM